MPCYDRNRYCCGAAYGDHSLETEHGRMGRACGVLQLKSRQSAGKAGKYCDVSDGTYSDSDGVSEGGYQGRAERDALSA